MNNRTEQLLDLYFSQAISADDEAELRQLLANDPSRAQEVSWQIQLTQRADLAGKHHPLKDRLRQEEQRLQSQPKSGGRFRLLYRSAAAILLLGVATWFFLDRIIPATPIDPEAVAIQNFEHFPNRIAIPVAGAVADDSIPLSVRDALRIYDRHNYQQAASALQTIVQQYPGEISYQFYYGVSLVGCKQFKEAIPPLELTSKQDNIYQTPALFYLALANIGASRFPQARQALKSYLDDTTNGIPYRAKAITLLEDLPE